MAVAADQLERLRTGGLAEHDPEIAALIGREADRQREPDRADRVRELHLAGRARGGRLGRSRTSTPRDIPGRRYYGGCEVVDEIEQLAIDRAKALFGAEHANVQPHAGAQANMAVYLGLLEPGDTVLSLRLDHGGHLTHGLKVNFSGRLYTIVHYGVSRETGVVDEDEVRALAREHRPKIIVCGGSRVPAHGRHGDVPADRGRGRRAALVRHGPFRRARRRRAAPEPGRGLRRRHLDHAQDARRPARRARPLPRGARDRRSTGPSSRGCREGRSSTSIAAKATCFRIAATDGFRAYQQQVRANADALAETLLAGGIDLLTGGTDTHLLQLDLRATEWSGKDAEERLHAVGLTTNRNTVPFDERPPTIASGVRVGTQAATMRGFDDDDFREVGSIIVDALADDADVAALARADVRALRAAPAVPRLPRLPDLPRRRRARLSRRVESATIGTR